MAAQIIDGKAIAGQIYEEIRAEIADLREKYGIVPGLATVLIGENPASKAYVASKQRTCVDCGFYSVGEHLPEDATQEQVEATVRRFNEDPAIHGILVQLPMPKHLNEEKILATISIEKDVDGFHPLNIGRLAMKGRKPLFVPCTPAGCIELLVRSGIEISGAEAVVLGRSNIVGLPVSLLLLHRDATVTICHSRSRNLPEICRRADILVAAVGQPRMVKADWVKPGAAVIDVGINRIPDPTAKSGSRMVGDVDFDEVKEVAGYITPVPGGVGPMTIAMLMWNTLAGAKRAAGLIE